MQFSGLIRDVTAKLTPFLDPADELGSIHARPSRARSFLRLTGRLARFAWQKAFFVAQWYLLFDLSDETPASFSSFRAIIPPKDRFWADPHVVHAQGHYYIFVEEYIHGSKKGHISVIEMDEHGRWRAPIPVLEKKHHLSYPNVFEWQGRYYMVPESVANGTIELYECVEFPQRWVLAKTLMKNVNAVDTTLAYLHDRWWLFTGIAENRALLPKARLHLFFADDLFADEWRPHPLNPIIPDPRFGRPAGALVMADGKLLRPSQDCAKSYGYGFDLNEITLLSDTEYSEMKVLAVRPGWSRSVRAIHTFARVGRLTVVDAFMRRPRLEMARSRTGSG